MILQPYHVPLYCNCRVNSCHPWSDAFLPHRAMIPLVFRSFSLLVYACLDELFSHGFSFLWLVRSLDVSLNE